MVEVGRPVEAACDAAGVSPGTIYAWLRDGRGAEAGEKREFALAYDRLKACLLYTSPSPRDRS